jgi:putative ABC transport system permease protein
VEGRSVDQQNQDVEYRVATPSYFQTMGIPLRAGRFFDRHDDANAPFVLVVNETLARKFWPGESAVGKRVKLGANPERQPWITIVGVAGDLHHVGLDVEPRPEIYRPYAVNPLGAPIVVVRTERDPTLFVNALAGAVRSVAPGTAVYDVQAMQTLVDRSTAERRLIMWLLTGFAASAMLLAGVWVYAAISQSVVQRTREIGLRMALGASPSAALALIFLHGARLLAAGILFGGFAALALARGMQKLLFGVQPLDPAAFLGASLVVAVFAGLACYFPARRALHIDPLEALRQE